jgi:WD40 repeat protein/tetratricopeptide (TPR) repeat protein
LWSPATAEQIAKPPAPDLGGFHVSAVAFSPDGQWLATGRIDGSIDIYDVVRKVWIEKYAHRPHWRDVMDVAFSPGGKILASVGGDRALRLWHIDRDAEHVLTGVPTTIKEHAGCVSAVAFAPDGEHVVTGSCDRTIKFWNVQRQLHSGLAPIGVSGVDRRCHVSSLSFSADGQTLATGGFQAGVELWDVRTGRKLHCIVEPEPLRVTLTQLSDDGQTLVVWDPSWESRGRVEVWHVPTRTRQDIPHDGGRRGHLGGVALSPDGNVVASGAEDGTVTLWRASTAAELAVLKASPACVTALAFSHDGERLASGARDCRVKLWDMRDENNPVALDDLERGEFEDPIDTDGLAFSRDDHLLAALAADGTIRVWDVATRRWHVDLEGTSRDSATGQVGPRMAFAPDSRVLATVATDVELIKLWDLKTGLERGTFRGSAPPNHPIRAIAFCPTDGRTLAAGSRGYFTLLRASSPEQVRRRRYPDRAVASRRRARSAQALGKVDEAISLSEEALAQFQDLLGDDNLWAVETMLDLGLLLSEEARPERLVRAESLILSACAVIEAKLPVAHEWRLKALEALQVLYRPDRLGKPDELATSEFGLADPAVAEALTAQGLSMWRRPEDRTKAISMYRRAITLCPDAAKAHYRLAWAQSALGAHGEAMSALVEAMELDSRVALDDGCRAFFLLADSFTATVKSGSSFSSYVPQQLGALRKLHDVLEQDTRFAYDRTALTARMAEVEAVVRIGAVP